MADAPRIRVHSLLAQSEVNGPGQRAVVHFQGCDLNCQGCFNPETHGVESGLMWSAAELAAHVAGSAIDGVTVSGGEPFQQLDGLIALCLALRERGVDSILVFTGYALAEIEALPRGAEALAQIDVLVAGRFDATQTQAASILSSANQQLKLLSTRHSMDEFSEGGEVEIVIAPDGTVTLTGFPSAGLRRSVRKMGQ